MLTSANLITSSHLLRSSLHKCTPHHKVLSIWPWVSAESWAGEAGDDFIARYLWLILTDSKQTTYCNCLVRLRAMDWSSPRCFPSFSIYICTNNDSAAAKCSLCNPMNVVIFLTTLITKKVKVQFVCQVLIFQFENLFDNLIRSTFLFQNWDNML